MWAYQGHYVNQIGRKVLFVKLPALVIHFPESYIIVEWIQKCARIE